MPERQPFQTSFRRSSPPRIFWVLLVLVVAGVGGFALWRWKFANAPQPVAPEVESKPAAAPAAPAPALPMAEGDSLAKQLGADLSTSPELAKWLAEPDIMRRLVAAVNLIADGSSPRPVLSFLIPAGRFEVVKGPRGLHASPKGYARYDTVTRVVTSLDAAAIATTYGRVKPYIDSAFAQIGRPGQAFDGVLRQAIGSLIETPIPESEPELKEKGVVYAYKDPKLEELSPAKKLLLRMGPENARAIQAWLKKLDEALPKSSP
jgi:hypothetical protein